MSKKIAVYLSKQELEYALFGLGLLMESLDYQSKEYALSESLEERLEAELATFEE